MLILMPLYVSKLCPCTVFATYVILTFKSLYKLSTKSISTCFVIKSLDTQAAFNDRNFYSYFIKPIPPSLMSPINVFLFILSVVFN